MASLQIIGETDGKKPSKCSGLRGESPSGKGGRIALQHSVSVQTRHVVLGTLPCVSNQDAKLEKNADSDTLRLMGNPLRSRRMVVSEDQFPY